jgi:hypothetical protein
MDPPPRRRPLPGAVLVELCPSPPSKASCKSFLLLFFKKEALAFFSAKESASFLKKRSKKLL